MRPELHPVRQAVCRKSSVLSLINPRKYSDLLRKKTVFLEYSLLYLADQIVSCEEKKPKMVDWL